MMSETGGESESLRNSASCTFCAPPQSESGVNARTRARESGRKAFRIDGGWAARLALRTLTVAVLVLAVTAGRAAVDATVLPSSTTAAEAAKPAQQSTMDLQRIHPMLTLGQDTIQWAVQQTQQMQSILESIRRQEQLQRSLDSALRSQQQVQSILDSIRRQEQAQRSLDSALRTQQQMQGILDSIRRQEQLQRSLDSALRTQQQTQSIFDSIQRREGLQRSLDSALRSQQQVQVYTPPVSSPPAINISPPVYNPPTIHISPPVYSPPPVFGPQTVP